MATTAIRCGMTLCFDWASDTSHSIPMPPNARSPLVRRFVVTSIEAPTPQRIYEELYCGRGQAENLIKQLKSDLASDRTSCTTFLANFMRLLEHAAAYVLHQQLRTQALQHTALANAQPSSV